jgi:hypothetical protein
MVPFIILAETDSSNGSQNDNETQPANPEASQDRLIQLRSASVRLSLPDNQVSPSSVRSVSTIPKKREQSSSW